MKTKILIFAAFVFLFAFFQGCVLAEQLQETPEHVVQEFYSWYIKKEATLAYPVSDSEIYKYISNETLQKLRSDYYKNKLSDVDYFTKVQDFDDQDWISHTDVGKSSVSDGEATVPVVFGSTDKVSVLVSLKYKNRMWKIFKVDSVKN